MKKEKMILVPAAFLMTAMLAFPVMASERIEEVTIDISAVLTDSDNLEVEAEVSDDGCYVDEVTVTNTPSGDWNDSTKPKVKVTLGAESGYTFSTGLGRSDVYLGNDDQTVTSVSRSTSKLSVYVTLPKIEDIDTDYDSDDDLEVYDLFWDDSYGGVACWEGSDSAKKYQVRLYRDGSAVGSTYTTTNDYYNFCGSFTKSGSYTFKVKAIRGNNETSWQETDSKDVNSSEASAIYANRTAAAKYYGSGSSGSNNQTSSSSSMTYEILLIVVIGGIGSISGSCIASFLYVAASEWWLRFLDTETYIGAFKVPFLRTGFRMVVFSIIIMIVVLFFRRGLMGDRELSDVARSLRARLSGRSKKKEAAK